jgi:hypothetical protein
MKASDHDDALRLYFKEDAIRKLSHSRAAPPPMYHRKLQRILRDGFDRHINCEREPFAECRPYVVIPSAGLPQFRGCLRHPDDA